MADSYKKGTYGSYSAGFSGPSTTGSYDTWTFGSYPIPTVGGGPPVAVITYDTYSIGTVGLPSLQVPGNSEDYHCDIQSWNYAVNNGLDPRVDGKSWNGNNLTVNNIYDQYYAGKDTAKPQAGTKGFGFMSDGSSSSSDPSHMVYYEYNGGDTIKVWDPGKGTSYTTETWNFNGTASAKTTWVALPSLQ